MISFNYIILYAQQCYNSPWFIDARNIGIHHNATQGDKPLHIDGTDDNDCKDPAIKLSYHQQNPQLDIVGYFALKTPLNDPYSTFATPGDLVIQSPFNGENIILSTRKNTGRLRFGTSFDGATDFERMTILPNGFVGISITQPLGIFDVNNGMGLKRMIVSEGLYSGISLQLYRQQIEANSVGWLIENNNSEFEYDGGLFFKLTNPVNLALGALGNG